MVVDEILLQEAKDKLRITWVEDDNRIIRLVNAATVDLNTLCRMQLDYTSEGKAKTLMLEHVFYGWNNALHEFRKNYESELLELTILAATGRLNSVSDE